MERRELLKVLGGTLLAGASCAYAGRFLIVSGAKWTPADTPMSRRRWGLVVDITRCRPDCTACMEACRKENNVAHHGDSRWDIHWIRKVTLESGHDSNAAGKPVILLCNHCDKPPCAQVCPVQATYKRDDGIVIVDHHRCIGCRYCIPACPFDIPKFEFDSAFGKIGKCGMCEHLVEKGQIPEVMVEGVD